MWRNCVLSGLALALAMTGPVFGDGEFMFQQGIDGYLGTQDVAIQGPGALATDASRLRVKCLGGEEIYNTLIRFEDIEGDIPEGELVDTATLTLTWQFENVAWNTPQVTICTVNRAWSDTGATWDDAEIGMPWDEPGAGGDDRGSGSSGCESTLLPARVFSSSQYTDGQKLVMGLDPDWVQAWIDDPSSNFGVVMVMNPFFCSDVTLASSDDFSELGIAPLLTITTFTGDPPPAAPTDLTATATSVDQINLEWVDNADNETAFVIERSASGTEGPFEEIAVVEEVDATTYEDTGIDAETEYCYRVRAINLEKSSVDSNVACGVTFLPAPTDLTAITASESQIDVAWVDNSLTESVFEIERSTDGPEGTFTLLDVVDPDAQGYEDIAVDPDTEYCYRVRAVGAENSSDYSSVACDASLAAPTGLTAEAISSSQVNLDWTDNSGSETGFEIIRSAAGGLFEPLVTVGADTTFYEDADLDAQTEYCYRVGAVSAQGQSSYDPAINLDPVCATTLTANLCPYVFAADFNADCYVNREDLDMLIAEWGLATGGVANLDANPRIDYGDYALFLQEYLQCGGMLSDMDHNCVVDYLDYALLGDADLPTLLMLAEEWLVSCDPQTGICTGGSL